MTTSLRRAAAILATTTALGIVAAPAATAGVPTTTRITSPTPTQPIPTTYPTLNPPVSDGFFACTRKTGTSAAYVYAGFKDPDGSTQSLTVTLDSSFGGTTTMNLEQQYHAFFWQLVAIPPTDATLTIRARDAIGLQSPRYRATLHPDGSCSSPSVVSN